MDAQDLTPLPRKDLVWSIKFALQQNYGLLGRKRREVDFQILAEAVADHVLRSNIKVFQGPPGKPPKAGP